MFFHSEGHSWGAELEENQEEELVVRSVHILNKQKTVAAGFPELNFLL